MSILLFITRLVIFCIKLFILQVELWSHFISKERGRKQPKFFQCENNTFCSICYAYSKSLIKLSLIAKSFSDYKMISRYFWVIFEKHKIREQEILYFHIQTYYFKHFLELY